MKSFNNALCAAVSIASCMFAAAQAAPVDSAGALAVAAPGGAIQTVQFMPGSGFQYPKAHGAIVDWCAVWADGCGWPGAHQFCQRRGFGHALSFNVFHPGHTYVIGSDRYCDGGACKGFSFVRCG